MQRRRCVFGVFSPSYLRPSIIYSVPCHRIARALRDSRGRALHLIKIPFSTPELFSFAHDWQRAVKKANGLGSRMEKIRAFAKEYCTCPSKLWTIGQRSFSLHIIWSVKSVGYQTNYFVAMSISKWVVFTLDSSPNQFCRFGLTPLTPVSPHLGFRFFITVSFV